MASRTVSNVFDELYRRIHITARASFCAARRLERQYKWSQWTVTLASVALIFIPLTQSLDFSLKMNTKNLDVLEVFFAIIVLAFSLLIGSENHLLKADRMQRRGLELASIYYALEAFRENGGEDNLYRKFCADYDQILSKYDNHLPIDYLEHTLTKRADFYTSRSAYYLSRAKFILQSIELVTPYILLLLPCVYFLLISLFPSFSSSTP